MLAASFGENLYKINKEQETLEKRVRDDNPAVDTIVMKDYAFPKDYVKFNRMIGNPLNRSTNKAQDMTPYQVKTHDTKKNRHKIVINKARKIGSTEGIDRSIALDCFDTYKGHDILTVAGNELSVGREILTRFYELFQDKKSIGCAFYDIDGSKIYERDIIRRAAIHSQHPMIEFRNDTRHFALAASRSGKSQSFRGMDDLIAIHFSEAAHTGMLEDQPIMNALEPNLANRDDADFIIDSTPNGRRGLFFHYVMDIMEGKLTTWELLQFDYTYGLKYGVLSKKFIQEQRKNIRVDFNQEYCCKFTSTVSGVFKEEDIVLLPESERVSIDLRTLINQKDDTVPEREEIDY